MFLYKRDFKFWQRFYIDIPMVLLLKYDYIGLNGIWKKIDKFQKSCLRCLNLHDCRLKIYKLFPEQLLTKYAGYLLKLLIRNLTLLFWFFWYRAIWTKQSDLPELLFQKVYSNSFFVVASKNSSTIPLNHARFSNSPISYDDHLWKKETIMAQYHVNYGIYIFKW